MPHAVRQIERKYENGTCDLGQKPAILATGLIYGQDRVEKTHGGNDFSKSCGNSEGVR